MPSKATVYWDSCVFIDWMKTEPVPDRVKLIAPLVQLAEQNKLIIVTSSWALVEIIRTEGGNIRTPEEEKRMVDFFKNDFIEVRTLTRAVAEAARTLQRAAVNRGIRLPKADAVHLATAMDAKQSELHTFDENDLFPHDDLWGDPHIRIGKPCLPGQLVNPPEQNKQLGIDILFDAEKQ